jgi:hypothetical protein
MGLYGNLSTMSVGELLSWVGGGRKSGTLEVERDKIVKRITFDSGRVASCSSNDPATLMGQFLLSRGKITREMLSQAMSRQGGIPGRPANLGQILLEMGAITQADRDSFVLAKIEETIYGLFDWDDAVFRFYTDALADPNAVEASVGIDEILRRGGERSAERKLSGQAIGDPGMVLRATGEPPPPELASSRAARRVFELIDGKKTVAEIVLHSHATEFLVTRFLTALLNGKVVEIVEVRREPPRAPALPTAPPVVPLDVLPPVEAVELPQPVAPAEPDFELVPDVAKAPAPPLPAPEQPVAPLQLGDVDDLLSVFDSLPKPQPKVKAKPAPAPTTAPAPKPKPTRGYRLMPRQSTEVSRELQSEINVALQLMASGQPEAALELLNAIGAAHPTDTALRQLVANAEQDFCKKMLEGELHGSSVPTRGAGADSQELTAEESFLLEQVDGHTEIQALLWVAPMRDVEALKILYRMLKKGWLELRRAA